MSLPLQTCNNLERRRTRAAGAEVKEDEGVENEDGAGNAPILHNSGIGVSTRRTSYVMVSKRNHFVSSTALNLLFFVLFVVVFCVSLSELYIVPQDATSVEEKNLLSNLPAPAAPPKPARPTKPRPKSRISRYRSSSSQRARRQRQALAQQAAAAAAAAAALAATPASADQGGALDEEGTQGPYGGEHGHGEGDLGAQLLDPDGGVNCINRGNLRYPKTKKVRGL